MLNIDRHKATFVNILRDIYADPLLRTSLGFKGGTAAMLFYDLPRFSVDLDFDILNSEDKESIFKKVQKILETYGVLDESIEKKYTLFFLLNYQKGERNIKVEISKRATKATYLVKNYLGISLLVMKQEDMFAGKLSALLTRKRFATRDVFDLWFFLKNNWQINEDVLKDQTGMSLAEALKKAQKQVSKIKKTELLSGLGDLLESSQKVWVKEKMKDEVIFQLCLYQETH
jgi:predicted nucleotidyltransferase component of viral defense system